MAEKADLPSETVSLPPTYAPSEAYTESPPPAYHKSGMTAVRVARIVCFTLLAMTFVIGFFVVMHNWVENKNCNCDQSQVESKEIKHAALLAQLPNSDLNNNKIEEDIEKKEAVVNLVPGGVPKEDLIQRDQMIPESDTKFIESDAKNAAKDVSLPKDLLLGNPKLAGRNVHCKMEKRQRKIAEGIMTQAIIVTCDDEDDDDENEDDENSLNENIQGPIPVRPPLSLLNTIMKVLSARPRSNPNVPNLEQRPILFPARSLNGPMPIIHPLNGRFPINLPGPFSQAGLNFVPLRKIEVQRPFLRPEENEFSGPIIAHGPLPIMPEGRHLNMNGIFPPRNLMQRPEENSVHIQRIPFPLPGGPMPIRMIRLAPRRNEIFEENQPISREEEDNESPLPLPFHPLLKLLPARRRIIRFRPKQTLENGQDEPIPFPLPRGALPLRHPSDELIPHPMPEASGRALPSPVALPGVRVVRLPFRPQPQHFPEAKIITHMEVRQPSEDVNTSQEPKNTDIPDNVPENKSFSPDNLEFGPPKTHSVIQNSPRQLFGDEDSADEPLPLEPFHEEPITQTQSQPRFVAPPPPRFAKEGRTSFLAQINSDAELLPNLQENTNEEPQEPTSIHQIVLN